MSTQVNSYSGGAVLPGTTVTTDKLKKLKLRHTQAGAQASTDEVYDPLEEKVVNVQNCIFRKNGETIGTYDPLSGSTTQIDIPDDAREPSFDSGTIRGTATGNTAVLPTSTTIDGGVVQFNVLLGISSDGHGVEYTSPVLRVLVDDVAYGPEMKPLIDESVSDERTFGFSFCGALPSGQLSFRYEPNSTQTHAVSVSYTVLYGVVGGSGGGGGPYTFIPGTTTFSAMLAALEAGKTFVLVYAPSGGALLKTYYTGVTSSTLNGVSRIVLVHTSQTAMTFYTVDDSDNWTGPTTVSIDASGKVAVESGATAGFLKDVLVSASSLVTLVPNGNTLAVNVNTEYSSDPKLATMDESQVDGATSNYGDYELQSGAERLAWGDTAFETYQWLNANVYQCSRMASAQGTITKCSLALCGALSFQNPPPCFNVGIFDLEGNLLGQSGLRFYGTDFDSNEEFCEVDMTEEFSGSLNLKRNTRYIIQLWTCGIQLAGLDRSTDYNYTYDHTLRQNLETSVNLPKFIPVTQSMSRASVVPMLLFGAESLV